MISSEEFRKLNDILNDLVGYLEVSNYLEYRELSWKIPLSSLEFDFNSIYSKIENDFENFLQKKHARQRIKLRKIMNQIGSRQQATIYTVFSDRQNFKDMLEFYSDKLSDFCSYYSISKLLDIIARLSALQLPESFEIYLNELKECFLAKCYVASKVLFGILSEICITHFIKHFISYWDKSSRLNTAFRTTIALATRLDSLEKSYETDRAKRLSKLYKDVKKLGLSPDSEEIKIFTNKADFYDYVDAAQMVRVKRNPDIHPIIFTKKDIPTHEKLISKIDTMVTSWIELFKTIELINKIKKSKCILRK